MNTQQKHPVDSFLHPEKLPTVWCPGCGIGIVVNTFIQTLKGMKIKKDKTVIISSGISCTGKINHHLSLKNIIVEKPFEEAKKFKKRNPQSKVIVFFSDSELMVAGIDSLLDVCGRGVDICAIYINSFVCSTLFFHKKFTDFNFCRKDRKVEPKAVFNLPHLLKNQGASYIARWTPIHCRRLSYSIREGILKPGFSFIEVISPCLMYYASSGCEGNTIDRMGNYLKNATIENGHPLEKLSTEEMEHIIIGKFLDQT
jgi:2-oxoglutarate ferredoxin oxidoreductase subunit beta